MSRKGGLLRIRLIYFTGIGGSGSRGSEIDPGSRLGVLGTARAHSRILLAGIHIVNDAAIGFGQIDSLTIGADPIIFIWYLASLGAYSPV